jgi:Lon-like ATP-dependent protease
LQTFLGELDPDNQFLLSTPVHLHVPEGATPKDGPSAGVTIVSALVSLATNRPIRNSVAMTGEVSLTGKVFYCGIYERNAFVESLQVKCVLMKLWSSPVVLVTLRLCK